MYRFMREENGTVVVLVALAMVAVIGFSALTIDVGYLYFRKSQVTSSADAASLAGAVAMRDGKDVEAAVRSNLQANGFNETLNFVHNASEAGSDPNTVYIISGAKQVHVTLVQPESWFFANVLNRSTGNTLNAPMVGGLARAEVVSILGTGYPGHVIMCFNEKDDGVVKISGNVTIDSDVQISIHSNRHIEVEGTKANGAGNANPIGSYLGNAIGNIESFYTGGIYRPNAPMVSPFTNLLYDELGKYKIKSRDDLANAFPGASSVAYYNVGDLGPSTNSVRLTHPSDAGIRVVYINGNLIRDGGNRKVHIETNGGLVIIAGDLYIGGNASIYSDGIVYTTGVLELAGTPSIYGALWSEKKVLFRGNPETFSYNALDSSLYSGEETFSIKMVR